MTTLNPMQSTSILSRRSFVLGTATAVAAHALAGQDEAAPIPIIDTHIHLFDATRPQGAPYAGPGGDSSNVSLPPRYRKLAEPLGIVGAVKVEASPWVEDNLWALQVAQGDPMIVGVVGNLQPEKSEFKEYLNRYHRNPLFRGIRYGNLWGYDLAAQATNPVFIEGLKRLADADLVLDSANPNVKLLQAIIRVNDQVPKLRIVIDHLPAMEPTAASRSAYDRALAELRQRSNVFVKLSAVIHRVNGSVSNDLNAHRDRLDELMSVFGEDRVIFGSDWPNSDGVTSLDKIVRIVRDYFAAQPRRVTEKYFWRNSAKVYKWIHRAEDQPTA
ncbi:MAG: amidohydrolase family protein [Fuerstiella sp.]|nr:amidohydrolase family protein [Fuerstiella sp.]MCP4856298.1 amidohydrolase family protein [Fuerstiella sp.]